MYRKYIYFKTNFQNTFVGCVLYFKYREAKISCIFFYLFNTENKFFLRYFVFSAAKSHKVIVYFYVKQQQYSSFFKGNTQYKRYTYM